MLDQKLMHKPVKKIFSLVCTYISLQVLLINVVN